MGVVQWAPGPSVSEEIADIFTNYNIDGKLLRLLFTTHCKPVVSSVILVVANGFSTVSNNTESSDHISVKYKGEIWDPLILFNTSKNSNTECCIINRISSVWVIVDAISHKSAVLRIGKWHRGHRNTYYCRYSFSKCLRKIFRMPELKIQVLAVTILSKLRKNDLNMQMSIS